MLERVDDQVAQDALDAAGIHLGVARAVGGHRDGAAPAVCDRLGGLHGPGHGGPQVGDLGVEGRGPGVEAADLQQVCEQLLEPVELVVQQLGRPGHRGLEAGARVVDQVGGHPDRRQGGAQLVRHVGDEPLLHPREAFELADLGLQAVGHLVEGLGQPGQVVLTAGPHALVEPTRREALGDEGRAADRADHLAGHHPGDHADEEDQGQAADQEGPRDQVEGGLLPLHREHGIQVVAARQRRLDLRPDDHGRDVVARLRVGDADQHHLLTARVVAHRLPQRAWDHREPDRSAGEGLHGGVGRVVEAAREDEVALVVATGRGGVLQRPTGQEVEVGLAGGAVALVEGALHLGGQA